MTTATTSRLSRLTSLEMRGADQAVEVEPLFSDGLPNHYGGRSLAQALFAASLTVDRQDLVVHSAHAYFVAAGEQGVPVEFDIDRIREGRSSATRAVTSRQRGASLLTSLVSFHRRGAGDEWEPDTGDLAARRRPAKGPAVDLASPLGQFDVRPVSGISELGWPRHPLWIKTAQPVGDDPRVNTALLAYISDAGLVWTSRKAGTAALTTYRLASLDHALWIHREPSVDEWLYFEAGPVVNRHGRGLTHARIRDESGALVATVMQETLIRPPQLMGEQ